MTPVPPIIARLKEASAKATKGPLFPCARGDESPDLFGPNGVSDRARIAMFYWSCHPNTPEAIAKCEDEVYSLVELVALTRNSIDPLLRAFEAAMEENRVWRSEHGCGVPYAKEEHDDFIAPLSSAMAATDLALRELGEANE